MAITIYHNPKCSNSRAALALLREKAIEPRIVLYLKTPPGRPVLEDLLRRFAMPPMMLIRTGEPEFAASKLTPESSAADVVDALLAFPRLLQRPLIDLGDRVLVARPPAILLEHL